jgi:integrase/recombinase XerD
MLTQAVDSYLALRRTAGFALRSQGTLLRSFAAFSACRDESHVRTAVAIEWAGSAYSDFQRARRLGIVIRFARHLHAEDHSHEIPPQVFGCETPPRPTPYILSPEEVTNLVRASSQSGYRTLRRATYSTLFALLACTGLRVSEAIRLRFEDIVADGLLIRCSKFRKSRLVPLHPTACEELERYLAQRRPYALADDHLFISLRRKPLLPTDVDTAFRTAARVIGLPISPRHPRATPHSLRHTFAVRALQSCPADRDAITKHMVALSTYLGHAKVSDTYWYLEAVPELLQDISEQCERFVMGGQR